MMRSVVFSLFLVAIIFLPFYNGTMFAQSNNTDSQERIPLLSINNANGTIPLAPPTNFYSFNTISGSFKIKFLRDDNPNIFIDTTPNTTMKIYPIPTFNFTINIIDNASNNVYSQHGAIISGGVTYTFTTTEHPDGNYFFNATVYDGGNYTMLTKYMTINNAPPTSSSSSSSSTTTTSTNSSIPTTTDTISSAPGFLTIGVLISFAVIFISRKRMSH